MNLKKNLKHSLKDQLNHNSCRVNKFELLQLIHKNPQMVLLLLKLKYLNFYFLLNKI